jgi:hypothetical protein
VPVAAGNCVARREQRVDGGLRLGDLGDPHLFDQLQQTDLLLGAKPGERLGILLLPRGEHGAAQRLHLPAQFGGLLRQDGEPVLRDRTVTGRQYLADVDTGRDGAHQNVRIDRRVVERQLPLDALDVLAVPDLEQSVGDAIPVLDQLLVGWHTEVGHAGAQQTGDRLRSPEVGLSDPTVFGEPG